MRFIFDKSTGIVKDKKFGLYSGIAFSKNVGESIVTWIMLDSVGICWCFGGVCLRIGGRITSFFWPIIFTPVAKAPLFSSRFKFGGISNEFDIPSSTWTPSQLKGWFYHFGVGGLYCGPPNCYHNYHKNQNLKPVAQYEDIKIIMNMNKRSLKFIIINEDKGESYTNIPLDKPISPAIFLGSLNDSVEIIEC